MAQPVLENVNCNLCNSNNYEALYPSTLKEGDILSAEALACTNLGHGHYHRIVRCKECNMMYANPRDSSSLLSEFYEKVKDEEYCSASKRRYKTFSRVLRHLERYKKGSKLLDIGCYTGIFMETASLRGWNVTGMEPSKWAARISREKGFNVVNSDILEAGKIIKDKFDVITMWDVIEHVADPYATLTICREKLLDGGILGFSTLRCEGLFYSLCGSRWPWFMRMHLFYFTLETLSKMLKKAGFKMIGVYPYVHYISMDYLFYKMSSVNKSFLVFSRNNILKKIILPVYFGDLVEVYTVKA